MKYILYCLKLNLKSKLFFYSIVLSFLAIFIGLLGNRYLILSSFGLSLFYQGYNLSPTSVLPILVPFIAVLGAGDSFLIDSENNMVTAILSRTSRLKYYFSKIFVVGSIGAISIALPLLIMLLLSMMISPHGLNVYMAEFSKTGMTFGSFYQKSELNFAFFVIFNSAIFGFIYANIGLIASLFVTNKYIVIFMPFLVYILPSFVFDFLGLGRFSTMSTFDLTANTLTTPLNVGINFSVIIIVIIVVGYFKILSVSVGKNE